MIDALCYTLLKRLKEGSSVSAWKIGELFSTVKEKGKNILGHHDKSEK